MPTDIMARGLRLGLTLALIVLASAFFYRALDSGYDQLVAPFSLDAGEFSNLESIKVIRSGENPYSPEVYSAPPFVFTGYTPLYHYLVALFPMPDANPFFWGRVVAALAMLLAGLLPFLVAGRSGWPVASVAVGVFFALAPVAHRTVLIRNDSLGLLLAGLSIYVVHRAAGRFGWLVAAVGFSILSVFVKQVYLAAPVACAIWLFLADRQSFYRFMGAGLGLSVVIVLFIQFGWGTGFWFATISGPQHPFSLAEWSRRDCACFVARTPCRSALFGGIVPGCISGEGQGRPSLHRISLFTLCPYLDSDSCGHRGKDRLRYQLFY